jgi:NAD(P)-dependent dehydrogenase (short-subunit alcohol dehydrogenase family)
LVGSRLVSVHRPGSSWSVAAAGALIETAGGVAASATADVSDDGAVAQAITKLRHELGPVDLLVNNAGIVGPVGPTWEIEPDRWWRTMEVNLRGTLLCSSSSPRWCIGAVAAS